MFSSSASRSPSKDVCFSDSQGARSIRPVLFITITSREYKGPFTLALTLFFHSFRIASAGGENIKEKIKNPKIEPIHLLMSVCLSLHPRTVGQGR